MSSNYVASNKASSTVAAGFNATATAISLATGEGARFPAPTGGDYSLIVLQNTAGVREVVCMVGRTGDVITVGIPGSAAANVAGRNYEAIYGMSAAAWIIGDVVSCRPTAALLVAGANAPAAAAAAQTTANTAVADALAAAVTANAALPKAGGVLTGDLTMGAGKKVVFEGATDDAFELTVDPGDPTADRTQTHQDATGVIALIGVKEVIGCFPAAAMKVPTTAGAATLAWVESTTYKVMTGYLAFDKTTQEHAQFSFKAPTTLDESAGFTARFVWKEDAAATLHDCIWQIEMQAQSDGDTIDSAWGTAVAVTDTGAAGKRYISAETATITPSGSWAAGDEIIVRVSRKASDGADTLDVDAHLIEVVLMASFSASAEA